MNITRAVIISLDVLNAEILRTQVMRYMTPQVRVLKAVNASEAQAQTLNTLPLYTRHLIKNGRHNHVQIGNFAMLGCLLSHVQVWKTIGPSETVAVFEEDAFIDAVSTLRFKMMENDMKGVEWDLVLLDKGQLIDSGKTEYVNSGMAARCVEGGACMRFGTRGYLIRHEAAQKLIRVADPPIVQVDALISLAAMHQGFKLYWSTENIAQATLWRFSTVWDGCVWECFFREWLALLMVVPFFIFMCNGVRRWCQKDVLSKETQGGEMKGV